MWDSAIFQLFGSQYNVAAVEQLVERGLSVSHHQACRAGTACSSVVAARGVVRLAGRDETFESRAMAPPPAQPSSRTFLSGPTAAALRGSAGHAEVDGSSSSLPETERPVATDPPGRSLVYASWIDPDEDFDDASRRSPGGAAAAHAVRARRTVHPTSLRARGRGRLAPRPGHAERGRRTTWPRVRRSGRGGVTRFQTWLEKTECAAPTEQRPDSSVDIRRDDPLAPGCPSPSASIHSRLRNGVHDPHRSGLAGPPAGRRAGTQLVARRGPAPACATRRATRACNELGWLIVPYDETRTGRAARPRSPSWSRIYRERVRPFLRARIAVSL